MPEGVEIVREHPYFFQYMLEYQNCPPDQRRRIEALLSAAEVEIPVDRNTSPTQDEFGDEPKELDTTSTDGDR